MSKHSSLKTPGNKKHGNADIRVGFSSHKEKMSYERKKQCNMEPFHFLFFIPTR